MLNSPSIEANILPGEMADRIDNCSLGLAPLLSGTCILTWSLARHPNIIAFEECGWMGDLAIGRAIYFSARNRKR
jgi:steroid 5-alpha reductase family enzyme